MKELKKYMNCDEYVTKFFQKMPIDEVIMSGINHELIKKSNNTDKMNRIFAAYLSMIDICALVKRSFFLWFHYKYNIFLSTMFD